LAKCELNIHLEDRQAVYHPGDVVRGHVEVQADREVECKELRTGLRWQTRGKGEPVLGQAEDLTLFEGTWRAGEHRRYDFEMTFPAGPFTYHGHHLEVVWEVRAEADIPWALDPKAVEEIVLQPRPGDEPDWEAAVATPSLLPKELRPDAEEQPAEERSTASKAAGNAVGLGCLAVFLLGPVALLGLALKGVVDFYRGEIPSTAGVAWSLATVALLVIVGGGVLKLVSALMASRKLGEVTLEVEPRFVRTGDSLQVKITCQPNQEAELQSVVAHLKAEEKVRRSSGKRKRSYKQVVYEQETEIALGRRLARDMPSQIEGKVDVPPDAPPTFLAPRNELRWTLTLRMDIARWPDWTGKREIVVHR